MDRLWRIIFLSLNGRHGHGGETMTTQEGLWTGAGLALGIAVAAGIAEWRRTRRRELDDAGWVPWRGVQVAAMFSAAALIILATRL
jgi:hypothetical protein